MNKNLKKENKNTTFGQGVVFFHMLITPKGWRQRDYTGL